MAFYSQEEVELRLLRVDDPLAEEEIADCFVWLNLINDNAKERLRLEIQLQQLRSQRESNKTGRKANRVSMALNIALFLLSVLALAVSNKSYLSAEASSAAQTGEMEKQGFCP
jgi:hypothetical protein